MEARITMITLGVKDIARSYKFYHDGLGFPTSAKEDDEIVFFRTGGTCLALYTFEDLAKDVSPEFVNFAKEKCKFSGITLAHNVRVKEDVERILKLAEKAGGKIEKQAGDVFWGGYNGYFSDPDGYLWDVVWAEQIKFNEDGSLVMW